MCFYFFSCAHITFINFHLTFRFRFAVPSEAVGDDDVEGDEALEDLRAQVAALEKKLKRRSAATCTRTSKPRAFKKPKHAGNDECEDDADEEGGSDADRRRRRRVRSCSRTLLSILGKRAGIAALVLNNVVLSQPVAVRNEMRGLGAVAQERYLMTRDVVRTMNTE